MYVLMILLRYIRGGFEKGRADHVFNHKWFWVGIGEVGIKKQNLNTDYWRNLR